jgi:hypothetical protein
MYPYTCTVVCETCNKTSVLTLLSVNPNKTHISQPWQMKGPAGKTKLNCGHYQNLDGYPVEKKQ